MDNEETKKVTKTNHVKLDLDALEAKEKLKEIENQIDILNKKYKEFKKLSEKGNLSRDIGVFATYIASIIWLYKDDVIHAIFCLILILVINQIYKK